MISLSDLTTYDPGGSWDADKVTAVGNVYQSMVYKAVLKQYAPEWTDKTAPTSTPGVLMAGGTYILSGVRQTTVLQARSSDSHVYQYNLPNEDSSSQSWSLISHSTTGTPIALTMTEPVSDTDPRIIWAVSTDVYIKNLGTGGTATLALGKTVAFLAGTVGDCFHFVYVTPKNNWRLGYYDGSTVTYSDIYWPFKISGFSAARTGDHDVIILATELPPITDFTVNEKKLEPAFHFAAGMVAFRFHRTSLAWSDHTVVWKNEREENNATADSLDYDPLNVIVPGQVHLTRFPNALGQDEVFAVAPVDIGYASEAEDRYVLAMFKSIDGLTWEAPVYYAAQKSSPARAGWPWAADSTFFLANGAKLLRNGNYMYLAHPLVCQRSPGTCWLGDASPILTQDITNYVTMVSIDASKQRACGLELTNPAEVLTQPTALLGKGRSLKGYVWVGYHSNVDSVEVDLLVPSFVGDVLSAQEKTGLPEKSLSVQLGDSLELVQMVGASDAIEWPGLMAGGDNFVGSESGVNSSGLGHTAPGSGTWKSGIIDAIPTGALLMECEGAEGLASSTFTAKAWNGLIGAKMVAFPTTGTPPNLDGYTWQGLYFRMADKNNMWWVKWIPGATATYQLMRRYVGAYGEVVQNGSLDSADNWTVGSGWSIMGGEAIHTSGTATLSQSLVGKATIGARFKVKFTIVQRNTGSVHVALGTSVTPDRSETGLFEEDFDNSNNELVMAGSASVAIVPSTDFDGKIDDISVTPVPMDFACVNSGDDIAVYSAADATPYTSGAVDVRWRYGFVEVFVDGVLRIHYEMIGCGTSGSWSKVTLENGMVGYPLHAGNAGYLGYTTYSQNNLVADKNPGGEINPLVLVGDNEAASGWSVQVSATAARSTAQHHRGAASILVTPNVALNGGSGIRLAKYFAPGDFTVRGDTFTASGWVKIPYTNTVGDNSVGVTVEAQYVLGQRGDYSNIPEIPMYPTTANGGWMQWGTSISATKAKAVKVIIEIGYFGEGQSGTMEFYVDDMEINSTLVPGKKQYLAFYDVHVSDGMTAYSLQDAVGLMAGYAGILTDRAYTYADFSDFALSGGMVLASGDISSPVSSDSLALSPDDFSPSFAIEFDQTSANGQVFLFGNRSTASYRFIWSASGICFKRDSAEHWLPFTFALGTHFKLAVFSRSDNSKADKLGNVDWLTMALYANGAYVASWSYPIHDMSKILGPIGFGSYGGAAFLCNNFTMDSLYRILPYYSIDPGEKASEGIGRAISNYRVVIQGRFNGHVRVFRLPVSYTSVWDGLDNTRAEGANRTRQLIPTNTWRVYGAWKQTDWTAHEAHQKAWRRLFEKIDNPNLLNLLELRREVQYLSQDMVGQLNRPGVSMPYHPLLEIGDVITWQGDKMLLEGIQTAFAMRGDSIMYNNSVGGREVP